MVVQRTKSLLTHRQTTGNTNSKGRGNDDPETSGNIDASVLHLREHKTRVAPCFETHGAHASASKCCRQCAAQSVETITMCSAFFLVFALPCHTLSNMYASRSTRRARPASQPSLSAAFLSLCLPLSLSAPVLCSSCSTPWPLSTDAGRHAPNVLSLFLPTLSLCRRTRTVGL